MYKLESAGTDPEVFISQDSNIISAIGLIGGSKEEPLAVDGGALQEDNVLAEFNISPAKTDKEFVKNIRHVMEQLKYRVGPRHDLVIKSSHRFTQEVLEMAGPKAHQFGCDPDYNAYTGEVNEPPNPFTTLRTAGGHVHTCFGMKDPGSDPFKAAVMMDIFLGIPSVLLDDDVERRSMYGQAGACRPKLISDGAPYDGVEYRSLSNFWLASDTLMKWVFNNTEMAISNMHNIRDFLGSVSSDIIIDTINNSNKDQAAKIINTFGIPMPAAA